MIIVSQLHRELIKTSDTNFSHNDVKQLLEGKKGKFSKKEIRMLRAFIKRGLTQIDSVLEKLENQ